MTALTEHAAARWGTAHDARLAEIMPALIRHLHDFAREVRLTGPEWLAAMEWLTRTGQISDDKRDEFILASDVLGLSTLVVELNHHADRRATAATILGPFHIEGSPMMDHGSDMAEGVAGTPLYITGRVVDVDGRVVSGALLDVWQADGDGLYEAQVEAANPRLRARYTSRADGTYCVRTITPRGYTIPMDGPVGELISRTEISNYRPAHVHFIVSAPGYRQVVTHLFPSGDDHLGADVVFGAKDELTVDFTRREPGPAPDGRWCDVPWSLAEHDFVLQPSTDKDKS